MPIDQATSRRRFLQFLAGSPLLAGSLPAFAEGPVAGTKLSDPIIWAPLKTENLIKSRRRRSTFSISSRPAAPTFRPRILATWLPASMMKSRCVPIAKTS